MGQRLQPAFWGGLFIGVLSALPLVNLGNCCCCLWIVSGGVLAAYLRQQQSPYAIQASEGALVGLMAGVIGGIITMLLSIPLQALTGPMEHRMLDGVMSANPDMPGWLRDAVDRASSQTGFHPVQAALSLVYYVIVGLVFGMLGGLLGVAIFKKNAPPPPPVTVEVLPPLP